MRDLFGPQPISFMKIKGFATIFLIAPALTTCVLIITGLIITSTKEEKDAGINLFVQDLAHTPCSTID